VNLPYTLTVENDQPLLPKPTITSVRETEDGKAEIDWRSNANASEIAKVRIQDQGKIKILHTNGIFIYILVLKASLRSSHSGTYADIFGHAAEMAGKRVIETVPFLYWMFGKYLNSGSCTSSRRQEFDYGKIKPFPPCFRL
jgi:hypothetical protein